MIGLLMFVVVLVIDFSYLTILVFGNLPYEKITTRKLPKVSVIITAREGKIVENVLKSLKKVKKPKLEIIVATNSRETARVAGRYTKKIIIDKGIGKGAALNVAVKKASGKILYFLDEDTVVEKDTIAKVCSALNGYEVVSGFNLPENKENFVSRISSLYVVMLNKIQYALYNLIGTTIVGGRNFAIYKNTLKELDGFKNVLTEDIDLSFRLFTRHKKVKFLNATVREQVPSKISWYIKQQQRWNLGAGNVLKQWEKRLHHHDIILFSFLLLIALVTPISLIFLILAVTFKSWIFFSVTLIGFLVCLSGAIELGRDDVALLPVTFVIFMAVQTYAVIYSAIKKPSSWYRTPKEEL